MLCASAIIICRDAIVRVASGQVETGILSTDAHSISFAQTHLVISAGNYR